MQTYWQLAVCSKEFDVILLLSLENPCKNNKGTSPYRLSCGHGKFD